MVFPFKEKGFPRKSLCFLCGCASSVLAKISSLLYREFFQQNKEQLSLKLKVNTFEYTNRERDSKRDKYSSGVVKGLEARFAPIVLGWLVRSST